jgi:hypothetical protein
MILLQDSCNTKPPRPQPTTIKPKADQVAHTASQNGSRSSAKQHPIGTGRKWLHIALASAEKAALGLMEKNNPKSDLTKICPTLVDGPPAHAILSLARFNESSADIHNLSSGLQKTVLVTCSYGFVDVRDLEEVYSRVYVSFDAAGQMYCTAPSAGIHPTRSVR